jgi:hypothetical protein
MTGDVPEYGLTMAPNALQKNQLFFVKYRIFPGKGPNFLAHRGSIRQLERFGVVT